LRQSRLNVLEFFLTVLLLELTPGPNMAYLATVALDRGQACGLAGNGRRCRKQRGRIMQPRLICVKMLSLECSNLE
jgi:hypothetical protein